MAARGALQRDVWFALKGAVSTEAQRDGSWRTKGFDCDGDDITIVVVIQGQLLVVTVFLEEP